MDIHSILAQLEAEKLTESTTAKVYRYMGLMQTIGLFSQRLTHDQCLDIAFDSVNELVTIAHAILYQTQEADAGKRERMASSELPESADALWLRKAKGIEHAPESLSMTEAIRSLPLVGTGILIRQKALRALLGDELCDRLQIRALVPFVDDDTLKGVILLGDKVSGSFDNDDAIILEALMRLANGAMENNRRYAEMVRVNREMDTKVFDLFAINQATRLLLGETSLESLAHLSVDVFAEMTRSGRTSVFLFNEQNNRLDMLAYLNTLDMSDQPWLSLAHNWSGLPDPLPKVVDLLDVEGSRLIASAFPDEDGRLSAVGARFVVLLERQGKVAGFVTLGDRIGGEPYAAGQFEVIESLAAATLIAVDNARLIEALGRQKRDLRERLERLLSLSTLIKNINSSGNMETLLELTGRTLETSFDVRKGMILLYDEETTTLHVARTIGFDGSGIIKVSGAWEPVLSGTVICEAGTRRLREFFPESLLPTGDGMEGILIEPIYHTDIRKLLLGVLVVFKFTDTSVREPENLLTMEAISNHLSLMIIALTSLNRQRRFRMPLHVETFKRELRRRIEEARERGEQFDLLQVSDERGYVFRENNLAHKLEAHYEHVYPVAHNDVFVLPDGDGGESSEALARLFGEDEVGIRVLRFGRDFSSYKEFFDLQ